MIKTEEFNTIYLINNGMSGTTSLKQIHLLFGKITKGLRVSTQIKKNLTQLKRVKRRFNLNNTKIQISLDPFEKALLSLQEALSQSTFNKLERDGVIQRFEYSYELSWKSAKRVMEIEGISIDTPKSVFRELGRLGWTANVEAWMEFHKSRNLTSHEYGEKLAENSFLLAKQFLPLALELLTTLKNKIAQDG